MYADASAVLLRHGHTAGRGRGGFGCSFQPKSPRRSLGLGSVPGTVTVGSLVLTSGAGEAWEPGCVLLLLPEGAGLWMR